MIDFQRNDWNMKYIIYLIHLDMPYTTYYIASGGASFLYTTHALQIDTHLCT